MFWEDTTLFDEKFFAQALGLEQSEQTFTIRHIVSDSRYIPQAKLSCFAGVKGENFDGSDYAPKAYQQGVRVFLLGKHIPLPPDAAVFIVPNVVQALGKLAKAHKERLMIPHILITGSVGKTSTRLMAAAVFSQKYPIHTAKKNFNNEIGLPLSILETASEARASILEAGMNSSGEIGRLSLITKPEIAVITNIHLIHSGHVGNLEAIAQAKTEIVEGMDKASILIINENEPFKEMIIKKAKGKVIFFRPSALTLIQDKGSTGFSFSHSSYPDMEFFCPLAGTHLFLNLAIVFTLAELFNIPPVLIKNGLQNMEPISERMSFLKKENATVISDCYNASLPSFKAALDVLKKSEAPRTAVMGDILELGSFSESIHDELMDYLIYNNCADRVLIFGPCMSTAAQKRKDLSLVKIYPKLEELRRTLPQLYQEGGTILIKASHGMHFSLLLET